MAAPQSRQNSTRPPGSMALSGLDGPRVPGRLVSLSLHRCQRSESISGLIVMSSFP